MGKTNMFESIDLLINHASFVLSCDSWSLWYGIASRTKTACAVNDKFLKGYPWCINCRPLYSQVFGNEDVYKDYPAKSNEQCDINLAEWINDNA